MRIGLVQALLDLTPPGTMKLEKMFKHQNTSLSIFMLPKDVVEAEERNGAPANCLALNVCEHLDPNQWKLFGGEEKATVKCGEQGVTWTGF